MSEAREWLVQWLRDAHAMEEQAETMLSGQLSRLENYPELSNRIQLHLDETRMQASRLRDCLGRIGEDTSTLKDTGAKLMAFALSVSGLFAGDEVMKGSLASYTFELQPKLPVKTTWLGFARRTCGRRRLWPSG